MNPEPAVALQMVRNPQFGYEHVQNASRNAAMGLLDNRHRTLIYSGNRLKMANPREHPHLPAVACWRRSGWMGGRTETSVIRSLYPQTSGLRAWLYWEPAKAEVDNNVECVYPIVSRAFLHTEEPSVAPRFSFSKFATTRVRHLSCRRLYECIAI